MGLKLVERLKGFLTAINVEPAWFLYFVGIGMFYMPSQVPLKSLPKKKIHIEENFKGALPGEGVQSESRPLLCNL